MCGIAGILNVGAAPPVAAEELRTMAAALVHRGPDDEGYHIDPRGRCGLAFRRLAIIDLAGGNQPIANEDGTIHVVFNGEIYNFRELRAELEAAGHRFATRTDTEVIVHLYEDLGEQGVERLAGMFAFAIWDAQRGRLLLARDRFGKKPLTYAVLGERLYFASEAKAILALPGIPRTIDPQSLHRYLVFQYVPAPHSIYRGFRRLPPGHVLSVCHGRVGSAVGEPSRPYYRLDPPRFAGTYADAQTRLDELLTAAVRKRLVADVPLGAFLSGGIDSSIVVRLMQRLGVAPLRTFTIGFPHPRYDETAHARTMAALCGSEHREQHVTPQAREVLDTLAYHYDEPFADSSTIPTYYVARYTRQFVTVALTGDGGDEAFAGYDRYRAAALTARLGALPRPARAALAAAARWIPHAQPRTLGSRLYRLLSTLPAAPADRYLAWVNVFPPALLASGYTAEFRARLAFDEPRDWLAGLYAAAPGPDAERANRTDLVSYLPGDLLTKVDLASMACSLECRAPFLDHELVEFALSLPLEWRLGRGGGKRILKDWAARGVLPPEIRARPKMGFGVPVGAWLRAELADLLHERVLSPGGLCAAIFRPAWLRELVDDHVAGRTNYEHPLWALLMLELWHARWQPAL